MKLTPAILGLVLGFGPPVFLVAQRQAQELAADWKFIRQDMPSTAKTDAWQSVAVPHTWNAEDGANGMAADPQHPSGYYRGVGWYARNLGVPADWKTKRVFIRFEGVALVADVLVNGIPIGQHRGGYAAFCYEITPYLRFDGKDTVRVRADNARAFDVAPLSGDFTVFGGIYRPVRLIATDEVCVSPTEFASPGVFLTLKKLTPGEAAIEARAIVSHGGKAKTRAQVEVEVKDASGARVAQQARSVDLDAGATMTVSQDLRVAKPRLWQARKDPYLYSATVRILRDGKVVDEVTQPLGIRTVALTPQHGFLLNGQPYPLHGVNRHQDRDGKGTALSPADHEEDHAMIVEIGATCLRLAHYQQADQIHDLSDRTGIIEWQEIPLVDAVGGSPQFLENARQQLKELILQGYNHPSLSMWGLYNELDASWSMVATAPSIPVITNLQELAKQLDPTRPTVAAFKDGDASALASVPDWVGWNIYPGWYNAQPDQIAPWIDKYHAKMGKRIALSEYGAGANPRQFQEGAPKKPNPDGPFHPQEWQNYCHERDWALVKDSPKLWGTFVWVMFDFASDKRNEGGTPGINDKGLVTRDRKIKKDTFYFYKANWNPEPMVYLASRRMTPRKLAATEVKAYSNCAEVELKVNGVSAGTVKPDEVRVCRWPNVQLKPGTNHIEAVARAGDKSLTDACDWELAAAAGPAAPPAPQGRP